MTLSARTIKDIRLLLPSLLSGIGLMFVAMLYGQGSLFARFFIACLLVANTSLGTELETSMLAQQLALPIPRTQLWQEKNFTLICSLGFITLVFLVLSQASYSPEFRGNPFLWWLTAIVPLFALGACHAMNLLLGQPKAAFFGVLGAIVFAIFVSGYSSQPRVCFCVTLCALGMLGWNYSSRRFRKVEDFHPLSKTRWLDGNLGAALPASARRHTRILPALIGKEVRLQRLNVLFVILCILFSLVAQPNSVYQGDYEMMLRMLVATIPFAAGTLSVVEEFRLGLHAEQLCRPFSRRRLWLIKFLTSQFTALALSGAMTVSLASHWGWPLDRILDPDWLAYSFGATSVAFGAAAIGQTYIRSAASLMGVFLFTIVLLQPDWPPLSWFSMEITYGLFSPLFRISLILWFVWIGCRMLSQPLSFAKRCRTVVRSILFVYGCVLALSWIAAVPFANLSAPVRTMTDARPSPTTPHGHSRLNDWRDFARHRSSLYIDPAGRLHGRTPGWSGQPITLLSQDTNWLSTCGGESGSLALKGDGSVWGLAGREIIDRYVDSRPWRLALTNLYTTNFSLFGETTNWIRLSGSGNRFAGIKSDGTLWTWGVDRPIAYTQRTKSRWRPPSRISPETNWLQVLHYSWGLYALNSAGQVYRADLTPPDQDRPYPELQPLKPFTSLTGLQIKSLGGREHHWEMFITADNEALFWSPHDAGLPGLIPEPRHFGLHTLNSDFQQETVGRGNLAVTHDGRLVAVRYNSVNKTHQLHPFDERAMWADTSDIYRGSGYSHLALAKDGSVWEISGLNYSHLASRHDLLRDLPRGRDHPRWHELLIPRLQYRRLGTIYEPRFIR